MPTRCRHEALGLLAILVLLLSVPGLAHAQALDMDQPEITKGERELKSVNTINGRYAPGSAGVPRSSHELSAAYSPLDWFKVTGLVDAENVLADGWRVDHVALESQAELIKPGKSGGLGLGWFTSVQLSTDPLSTNSLVFGPILKLSRDKGSFTLNTYFEDTFGRNSAPGLAFLYGWQARVGLNESFALGVEGYGKFDNIGDAQPWSEQDHRIGPAAYFTWNPGDNRAVNLTTTVLAGLTEASPGVSFNLTLGTTF